jgi:hypothetical protein
MLNFINRIQFSACHPYLNFSTRHISRDIYSNPIPTRRKRNIIVCPVLFATGKILLLSMRYSMIFWKSSSLILKQRKVGKLPACSFTKRFFSFLPFYWKAPLDTFMNTPVHNIQNGSKTISSSCFINKKRNFFLFKSLCSRKTRRCLSLLDTPIHNT